jgi:zinc-ribbon domain
MSTVECANCRASVPKDSRFCPECGRPLVEAPTAEAVAARRLWPAEWGLIAVVLLTATGIVLLGARVWLWGSLLLLLAGGVYLLQRVTERRASRIVMGNVRARIAAHRELVSARSRGQIDLFRLRRELAELQAERSRGFHELGRVGYERDRAGVQAARAHLDDVTARIAAKEAEVEAHLHEMRSRVRAVQSQAAPTEKLEAPPEPGSSPAPERPAPEPEQPPAPQNRRRRAS